MLLLSIAAVGLLFYLAHRVGGNLLFPPALLAATWLVSLIGLFMAGASFFTVRSEALAVYVVGTAAFVFGGIATLAWLPAGPHQVHPPPTARLTHRALDVCLVVLVLGLPLYWFSLLRAVSDPESGAILHSIRAAQLALVDEPSSFDPVLNLSVLAQFVALAVYYESSSSSAHRWRGAIAVLLALLYGSASGTKGNAVVLLLMLAFLSSIRAGRVRFGPLLGAIGAGLLLFALGLLAVNFAYVGSSDLAGTLGDLVDTVNVYWLGGLVAFGEIVSSPASLPSTQPIHRFFLETARSLGLRVDVPPTHAEYSMISPSVDTNTYTIYFSYFKDHGWLGTIAIMLALGVIVSLSFRLAMRGGPIATLVYARLCAGLVLSLHAEHFLNDLNFLIKLLVFLLFMYRVLPALERQRRLETSHA